MVDKRPPEDDSEAPAPSQIPLLEDIVDSDVPKKAPGGKRRINYALDLDPEPPETHDLFNASRKPVSPETELPPVTEEMGPATGVDEQATPDEHIDTEDGDALDDLDERLKADEDDLVFADDIMIEGDLWVEDTSVEPPHTTFSNVPWSVVDELPPLTHPPYARLKDPANVAAAAPADAGPDNEARLRAGADRMVEDLVREYSQEIVSRLRDELTALLDELRTDKGPDTKT